MKIRRMVGGVSLAGLVTGAVLALGAPSASAATLDKAGWWYRPATAPGPLGSAIPKPPGTPDGGLVVQATPDGPNAVAAMTFSLTPEELGGTLSLTVASETGGKDAVMQACPVKAPWEPAEGGSFADRPQEDCNFGSAPGVLSEDGKTWTFDLTALVVGGKVDIVILPMALPQAGGQAPVYRPFSVSFEKPTSASLAPPDGLATGSTDFSTGSGDFATGDAGAETASSGSGSSFSPDVGPTDISGPESDFTAPSAVDGVALGGASALDAAPPAPAAGAVGGGGTGGQALATSPTSGGVANRRSLGLGLLLLSALAGLALAATRSPAVAAVLPPGLRPRGAGDAPADGGLGRFVRPRTGRAPAL